MPRFSANLAYLFTELPFLERFEAASAAGFKAVEIQFPYPYPAEAIREKLERTGLLLDLINMPAGDWEGGERGLAALPGRDEDFRQAVDLALEYAEALGVQKINCLCGIAAPSGESGPVLDGARFGTNSGSGRCAGNDGAGSGVQPDETSQVGQPGHIGKVGQTGQTGQLGQPGRAASGGADEVMERVAGRLAYAADRLAGSGRTLLAEGINSFDMPGFWLNGVGRARELFARAGRPNLRYQFDIYHAARMGEDVGRCIRENFDIIGHFQLADAPGRNQPGSGEVDFPALFALIDGLGYRGIIGLEYAPKPDTLGSLGWLEEYGLSL